MLLMALKQIREICQDPVNKQRGLCSLLEGQYLPVGPDAIEPGHIMQHNKAYCKMRDLWFMWPKNSGMRIFPVAWPVDGTVWWPTEYTASCLEHTAAEAYRIAYCTETMWTGNYGALRIELLEWMIKELEN